MKCPCCGAKISSLYLFRHIFNIYCNLECTNCLERICIQRTQFRLYAFSISSISIFCLVDINSTVLLMIMNLIKSVICSTFIFFLLSPTLKLVKFESD